MERTTHIITLIIMGLILTGVSISSYIEFTTGSIIGWIVFGGLTGLLFAYGCIASIVQFIRDSL